MRISAWAGVLLVATGTGTFAAEDGNQTPSAFAPFEHLIGGWKGRGIAAKDRLRGWSEKHAWAWRFADGKPIGMSVEMTGSKLFKKADLASDGAPGAYRLEGIDPEGKPVKYAGKLDMETGVLSLDRAHPPAETGAERIDFALDDNKIRYVLRLFRKEVGAPQYASVTDALMGKEGEAFAAGGSAADLPKCVVTGGAGSMTVAFEGKSYPICCSGCRDEFQENPAKYIAKFLARQGKDAATLKTTAATGKGNVQEEKGEAMPKTADPVAKDDEKEKAPDKSHAEAKAKVVLSLGQALEKSGRKQAALIYFKRVVKEFPDTESAETAQARIKELGG